VTLFPNVLEPATALKAYAPVGVKFWENQETALEGLKDLPTVGLPGVIGARKRRLKRLNILVMPRRPPSFGLQRQAEAGRQSRLFAGIESDGPHA
jgi:hypothetical protein